MVLLDLHVGLLAHLREHLGARHFFFPFRRNELEALADDGALQHLVLLRDAEAAVCRGEVREPRWTLRLSPEQAGHFGRELVVEFDQRFGRGRDAPHQRAGRVGIRGVFSDGRHARHGERKALGDRVDANPRESFERHLHRVSP